MTGHSAEEAELRVRYLSCEDRVERVSDCLLALHCVLDLWPRNTRAEPGMWLTTLTGSVNKATSKPAHCLWTMLTLRKGALPWVLLETFWRPGRPDYRSKLSSRAMWFTNKTLDRPAKGKPKPVYGMAVSIWNFFTNLVKADRFQKNKLNCSRKIHFQEKATWCETQTGMRSH